MPGAPHSAPMTLKSLLSHTRIRRFPGRDGCGTRVHTIPDALATSIAQTRSRICSCSSSSISWGSVIAGPSPHAREAGTRAARGPRSETEILTGVLEAQRATRQGQGPGARLLYGLRDQHALGVGGQPTPISRRRGVPAGIPGLLLSHAQQVRDEAGDGRRIVSRPAGPRQPISRSGRPRGSGC
jgi:hypothetical protein